MTWTMVWSARRARRTRSDKTERPHGGGRGGEGKGEEGRGVGCERGGGRRKERRVGFN